MLNGIPVHSYVLWTWCKHVQHPVLKATTPFLYALYGPVIRSIPAVPVVLTPALHAWPPSSPCSFQHLGSVPQPRAVGRADDNTRWGASPGGCVLLAACAYPPIPWLATNQVSVELLLQPFLQSRVASLGLSAQPKYLQTCLRCLLDVHRSFRSSLALRSLPLSYVPKTKHWVQKLRRKKRAISHTASIINRSENEPL